MSSTGRWLLPAALFLSIAAHGRQQAPVFRSGIAVTAYNFIAVDGDGRPVPDLKPDDLVLRVNGKDRRILSVEFQRLDALDSPARPASLPEPYSSNERTPSRTILIAVDPEHIRVGEARHILHALADMLAKLSPGDRVGVITMASGGVLLELTTDHAQAIEAVRSIAGRAQLRPSEFQISLSEALAVERGDQGVTNALVQRECTNPIDPGCPQRVVHEAQQQARTAERTTRTTTEVLRNVLRSMSAVEGPKTVVIVSGGLVGTTVTRRYLEEAGAAAADARANLYVLHHYDATADSFEPKVSATRSEDARTQGDGLQELTDLSGGTYMRVAAGAEGALNRLASEMSGYYLLTFEVRFERQAGRPSEDRAVHASQRRHASDSSFSLARHCQHSVWFPCRRRRAAVRARRVSRVTASHRRLHAARQ